MDKVQIWLIKIINHLFPQPSNLGELALAKTRISTYQDWERTEAERICPEFGDQWNLEGKHVLDIGSGLGGKTQYYASLEPETLLGIDLRLYSLQQAHAIHEQNESTGLIFVQGDAVQLPVVDNYFDVIVSVNVFEHVEDLRGTLLECRRVLKPNGIIFLHFPPFYSPWGAHLEGWINFPWPHVFFSDKTLISAAQQIEDELHHNQNLIPTAQVNWKEFTELPELNRITVREFFFLVSDVGFNIVSTSMLPFGRHYLLRYGIPGKIVLAGLNSLVRIPLIQEYITTKMVFLLTKS